jgi:hypothetical protein
MTVLIPDVRAWRRGSPEAAELFLAELRQSGWTEIPSPFEELVCRASLAQIERWRNRALYVLRLEEVFDPAWRIPVKLVSQSELLRCAIADPLRMWTLALSFVPSRDSFADRRFVERAIPWFPDLRQVGSVWAELQRGLAVLGCPDFHWAHTLFSSIRGFSGVRLTVQLLSQEGRKTAG